MKLVNAIWDLRNLHVPTAELDFDDRQIPTSDEFADATKDFTYLVAKVPVDENCISTFLQNQGFHFIECSINFRHNLRDFGSYQYMLIDSEIPYRQLKRSSDVDSVLNKIGAGLFCTDRIYLDSHFSHELAASRYVNWIQDELERGSELYSVIFEGEDVGFFTYKELEGKVSYPFLIGLYPEYRGRKLGAKLIMASLLLSMEKGCTSSSTLVSSNNPAIIKSHHSVGSYFAGMHYVFVKHQ